MICCLPVWTLLCSKWTVRPRLGSLDSRERPDRQVRARVFSIRVRFALGGSIALPPIGYPAIRYVLRRSVVGLDRHIHIYGAYTYVKFKSSQVLTCLAVEPDGSRRTGLAVRALN